MLPTTEIPWEKVIMNENTINTWLRERDLLNKDIKKNMRVNRKKNN